MKSVIYTKYGSPEVLQFKDIEKPEVKDHDILIRVYATTVTSGDVRQRRGTRKSLPLWPISKLAIGLFKPKKNMLGFDLAGEIEAIGKSVTKFEVGQKIFGLTGTGTNVEYRSISEEATFTQMPDNMTFEESTSIPFGASTALYFLRKAKIGKGQKVLINGASGAVGTFAVQLAKHMGAEVTGVCSHNNSGLVRSLGADYIVDYKIDDFTQTDKKYHVIFDTLGKSKYRDCKKILAENGHYLLTVFGYTQLLQMLWTSLFSKKNIVCAVSSETVENLEYLRGLAEAGVIKSVIDKTYTLDEIKQAHEHVEDGHKIGNVVIKM